MNLLDYDLFLFDFDGLLVNTEDLHYAAYKQMLAENGCQLNWDFATYCENAHVSTEYLAKAVYSEFPELYKKQSDFMKLREVKQEIYTQYLKEGKTQLMPGVFECLELLKKNGKPTFVVTNSPLNQVEIIRSRIPALKSIHTWITRECYQNPKPKPDGYLLALNQFGSDQNAIGFEDTPKGVDALLQTPITPVMVLPKRYPKLRSRYESKAHICESFYDLISTTSESH